MTSSAMKVDTADPIFALIEIVAAVAGGFLRWGGSEKSTD